MKIYLIGMPGSGKSTLGKSVAEAMLLPFIDLDQVIEESCKQKIPTIFKEKGEAYFRMIESSALNEWALKEVAFVMATGGGAPCFYNGIETMNATGLTLYIEVPTEILIERTKMRSDRPLLPVNDQEKLHHKLNQLIEQRSKVYRSAHVTLQTPTSKEILAAISERKSSRNNP